VRPWKTTKNDLSGPLHYATTHFGPFFNGFLGFGRNDHSLYMLVWAKTLMTLHLFMVVWAMAETTMHLFVAIWAKLKYHSFFACFFLPPPYRTFSLNLHLSLHLLLSHILSLFFLFSPPRCPLCTQLIIFSVLKESKCKSCTLVIIHNIFHN
jgi:hypothetical protein